jgi:hypothetical protein
VKAEIAIRRAFAVDRRVAEKQGQVFTLTFEQWWALWAPHWQRRGRREGDKWMVPTDPEMGFTPENVRVVALTDVMSARLNRQACEPAITRRGVFPAYADAWLSERGMPGDYLKPCDDDGIA